LRAALRRRPVAARAGDDRGAATIFVIGLSVMLFVLAGLVVDGGLAINARAEAADVAEQAARAGAQEINEDVLRGSGVVELSGEAAATAETFLESTSFAAEGGQITGITVNADEITVSVTRDYDTMLLSIINFDSFTVNSTATARPAVGIDGEL
jgi:Flp pilus assembly protein TadG